ncbi:MAG: hypothetical protein B6U69_02415 [Thermofilum sp. ex4484_15]|nr:MAG: hypothetical protein B6U69_02415 [Thermofilum sp. ex4484_15]
MSRELKLLKRALRGYFSYKLGRPKPLLAVFYVTARCNLRCVFCERWKKREGELSTKEALEVIDKLYDEGVVYINYSGGEPLLRKDLEILAERSRDYGCINTLNTNGTLITPLRAKRLGRVFDAITVSLDGFEEVHDKTRGVRGAFKYALKGIENLKRYSGTAVGVATTIYSANWHEVKEFFLYLKDRVDYVSFQPIGGTVERAYPPPEELSVPKEGIDKLVNGLLSLKEENEGYLVDPYWYIMGLRDYFRGRMEVKLCDAGKLYVGVNWKGELMLCPIREDTVIGNILSKEFKELLLSNGNAWAKVLKCEGCWSQCTTIISGTFRYGLGNLLQLKDMLKLWRIKRVN